MSKKQLKGTVVSDTMQKTVVVEVSRYFKHPKYSKYIRKSEKFKAHDENGEYKKGAVVIIEECSPISKGKNFRVLKKA